MGYYTPPTPPKPVLKAARPIGRRPIGWSDFNATTGVTSSLRKLPARITRHPILAHPDTVPGNTVQIGDSIYQVQLDPQGLGGFSLKKIGKAIGKAAKQTVNVVKKAAPIALALAPIPIIGGVVNKALSLQKSVKNFAPVKTVAAAQKNLSVLKQATATPPPTEAVPLPQYTAPAPTPATPDPRKQFQADQKAKWAARKAADDAAAAAKKIADDAVKAAKKADRAKAKAAAAKAAADADAGNAAKQAAAQAAADMSAQATQAAQAAAAVPMPSGGGGGGSSGDGGGGGGASYDAVATPDANVSADATDATEPPASEGMAKMLPIVMAAGLALVLLGKHK